MDALDFLYEGEALRQGTEASDLRQVLDGLNRLVQDAARLINGQRSQVSVRIVSVQSNSFDISSIIEVLARLQPIFIASKELYGGIKTAGEMIKVWLDIQKHLRGEPPTALIKSIGAITSK